MINKILFQLQPRFDFKLYFYIFHASNTDSHVYHFSIAFDLEIHSFDWLVRWFLSFISLIGWF